jgi:hypothetical protein
MQGVGFNAGALFCKGSFEKAARHRLIRVAMAPTVIRASATRVICS